MSKGVSRPPLLPPCRVCGDRASGFHYGANTCEGCKGFFRRALKNEGTFVCNNNNSCVLKPKKRNNCPACRYHKCLEVGMAKNAIRTGRYTHTVRTKYILECQGKDQLEAPHTNTGTGTATNSQSCDSTTSTGSTAGSPSSLSQLSVGSSGSHVSMTTGDVTPLDSNTPPRDEDFETQGPSEQEMDTIIAGLMKAQDQIHEEDLDIFLDKDKIKQRQKSFVTGEFAGGSDPAHNILVQNSSANNQALVSLAKGEDAMIQVAIYLNEGIKSLVTFAKSVPGFKSFPMEDQVILLKRSVVEFWILGHFNCMNAELGVFVGEVSMRKEDAGLHWDSNYLDRLYELADTLQKLNLTKDEVAVLRAVVLTFRDRAGLKNRDMVEAVQWQMIKCFRYLCQKKEEAFERRFSFVMDKLTLMRELTNTFEKSFHSLPVNDAISQKFPLLTEFFNS